MPEKLIYPIISKKFIPLGRGMLKFFPGLDVQIFQADLDIKPEEYISLLFVYAITIFLFTTASASFVLYTMHTLGLSGLVVAIIVGLIFSLISSGYFMTYPGRAVQNKVRGVERQLLYSMRHLLIKIKSGISIYDALNGIARGPYGIVSDEFKKAIRQINAGQSEDKAIEKLALSNSSFYFRRAIWQMANSLRAGSDFAIVLEGMISDLAWEQRTHMRRFGSELNSIALMYMMTTIIFPALTITFLIVIGSFTGIAVPQNAFFLVVLVVFVIQLFILYFIKSRRPAFED